MVSRVNAAFAMLLMLVGANANASNFYIGAHPDDIELFMNRNASVDIYTGQPTVLIVLAAGDAGNGSGGANVHNIPYYRSRLIAHEYAARYWASLVGGPVAKTISGTRTFGGHAIERSTIGLVTIYNLNLPDGGDGGGYAATGYQSVTRLAARRIPRITSVDGLNS